MIIKTKYLNRILLLVVLFVCGCNSSNKYQAEILWDRYGVPHIFAHEYDKLFYSFGWAQMKNHANLMLRLFAQSRGRAAEYYGEEYLDSDKWVHTHNIPERAKDWMELQKPAFKQYFESFTNGINDYAEKFPNEIDKENHVVLPIKPVDLLTHYQRVIMYHFVTNPRDAKFNPNSINQSKGSNTWAVGPSRSQSGNAMLIINPHLLWGDMFTWFEVQLNCGPLDIYGATLVGSPFIGIGFNDNIGWAHTNNVHDGQDLYKLILVDEGYKWGENTKLFNKKTVQLKVKQENGDVNIEKYIIKESIHGPIIREDNDFAYALRVVGQDQPFVFEQYFDMALSKNFDQFEKAISRLQNPFFTTMYADRDGRIMHLFGGRTPVRPKGDWDWLNTVPGDTPLTLWNNTHTYEELPKVIDSNSGWLQNANDPPWTTTIPLELNRHDYPSYMSRNFMHFRAQRSARMAYEDQKISFDELLLYKMDTRMELADRLLDDLILAVMKSEDELLKKASFVLQNWDRCTNNNSRGAILFKEWVDISGFKFDNSELFTIPWDEADPMNTPRGIKNLDMAVQNLKTASLEIKNKYDSLDVSWGDVYRIIKDEIDLPSNGGPGDPYGIFRVTSYKPIKNNRYAASGGDSFQAIVEFSSPLKALVGIGYGNASQKNSIHKTDQIKFYSQKELRPAWRTRNEIEKNLIDKDTF